ncbi:hypothetical protein EV193_110171 [Herbihabitans rhizosphaerae]|uniref:Lipoprotein LprG n=1 Tax=Herbihabitans rhizosphaerae TaxID=1872711 RepID=A0A4Q7KGN0_9PSEU|nr:hypothetical protein [Herbihabitans rhizosphaerae]RZS34021.1 hypothetical protein EV193_110171 [Herbihabitans rhizosphaerae]
MATRAIAIAVLLTAAFGLTACGTEEPGHRPIDAKAVADLVDRQTASRRTVHVRAVVAVGPVFGRWEGVVRTGPGGGADIRYTTERTRQRYVVLGDTVYTELDEVERALRRIDRPWRKVTEHSTDSLDRSAFDTARKTMAAVDVGRLTGRIRAGTVTRSTSEPLDGRPATHHTIEVPDTVVYELWVDGDGLPLRLVRGEDPKATPALGITITFSGWGEPVTVEAPPAAGVSGP